MTRARVTADGTVHLAFRGASNNVRDFWVLKGSSTANDFTAVRVNQDNWTINYCPMVGPEMTFAPGERALCAFMSNDRVYWSHADADLTTFTLHVATPSPTAQEIFPTAVANGSGHVLLLWQIGPMSVSSTAVVHWALYTEAGAFTGRQDDLGTSFSGTKATAFVGNDDNFYVVTTASKPLVIAEIPDESLAVGSPYTGPTPTLAAGAAPVTWSLVAGPPAMTIGQATGVVSWPGPAVSPTPYVVTIRATKGADSDDQTWLLTVVPPPPKPKPATIFTVR